VTESRLKLIPLYNLRGVLNLWKYLEDGIEAILNNAGDYTSLEKIFNDIMAGQLLLWVGFVDGNYAGFATTKIVDVPPSKRHLWIVHAFKKKKVSSEWFLEAHGILEVFSKKQGCQSIRFYGLRKPWQDKFFALGYREGYVEFVKDIENEDLQKNRN
jgi:hypothetical protein